MGTFGGALEARQIDASNGKLTADVTGEVETDEGVRKVGPGDMVFIPAEDKHRLRATESPLFYFEFQAPNRFKTTILDGTPDDLRWERVDGRVWVQT